MVCSSGTLSVPVWLVARVRSASVRATATQSAPMASASVSRPVMTPPAPRLKPPSGLGSWGARLLTTIGEQSGSVRVTYDRSEDAGVVLKIEVMSGRSVSAMLMGLASHDDGDAGERVFGRHRGAA